MEIVSKLIIRYKNLTQKIKQFISVYNNVYKEAYNISMHINSYMKNNEEILNMKLPDDITIPDNIFYIENALNNMENNINLSIDLLDNESTLNNTINKTILSELETLRGQINNEINPYLYSSEHKNLIHIFLETIKNEELSQLESLYNKYENTMDLYTHYLLTRLNATDIDTETEEQIRFKIEKLKYDTINKIEVENKLFSHSKQLNIQRYNLIPIHQGINEKTMIDIFFYIKNNSVSGGSDSKTISINNIKDNLKVLHSISLERKHGIFLMIRMSPKYVSYEFNKQSMLQKTSDTEGLSYTNLETYNFINRKINSNINTLNTNIQFGYPNASKWLIIRTMDNSTYDIYGDSKGNIIHNKNIIYKLERGSSLLIDTYNKVNSYNFAKQIRQINNIIVDDTSTKYMNTIKSITLKLKTEIEKRIDAGLTNVDDLYNVISGEWIKYYMINSIVDDIKEQGELLTCSALNNINRLSSFILKFIGEDISRIEIKKEIFSHNTMQYIINFAKRIMSTLVSKAIEKAMPINANIYEKIHIRKSLLNIN